MITILIIVIIVINVLNLSHVINSLVKLRFAVVDNKRQNASYEHVTCVGVIEMPHASRVQYTLQLWAASCGTTSVSGGALHSNRLWGN